MHTTDGRACYFTKIESDSFVKSQLIQNIYKPQIVNQTSFIKCTKVKGAIFHSCNSYFILFNHVISNSVNLSTFV